MLYQLKIYDADNENVFDEVDGGVEWIDEQQAWALVSRFGDFDGEEMFETEDPSWADLHVVPEEMSRFSREIGLEPVLLEYVDAVAESPSDYSTVPFAVFSYEE